MLLCSLEHGVTFHRTATSIIDIADLERTDMMKINAVVAVSLLSLTLIGCGSGTDTGSEATTDQTDGTSDMMGGDNDQPAVNLGTANGQDIDDVDVKMNPNMQHTEKEMTGADEIKEQRPEPQ